MKNLKFSLTLLLPLLIILISCADVNYSNSADPESGNFIPADIRIIAGNLPVNYNDTYTFNPVSRNENGDPVGFSIENDGLGTLMVDSITITGADSDQFYLSTLFLNQELISGDDTLYTISFRPTSYGVKTATVEIRCSDPANSLFTFTINGNVPAPNIVVTLGEKRELINLGDFRNLGYYNKNGTDDNWNVVFYIENQGSDDLILSDNPEYANITGMDSGSFSITKQPSNTISPGAYSTMIISIDTSTIINQNTYADVTITSNDEDMGAFTFHLMVQQCETVITDDVLAGGEFGFSVAVFGDFAVIGAPSQESDKGAVYVYRRIASVWTIISKLESNDLTGDKDLFGNSVAINDKYVVVGAAGFGLNSIGAAYVFHLSGASDWGNPSGGNDSQGTPIYFPDAKLQSSDKTDWDHFGKSVSVSGDTIVVGADLNDDSGSGSGSAYIYEWDGVADWSDTGAGTNASPYTERVKLLAVDGAAADNFGHSVAISGDYIIIGAPGKTIDLNTGQGAVYIFYRDGGVWSQQIKLTAGDGETYDDFGRSVAIYGNEVIVGAKNDNIDYNGNDNHTGEPNELDTGSAYIFSRNGISDWTQQAKLTTMNGGASNHFGQSVSLSDTHAVAGAPGWDIELSSSQGAAFVFKKPSSGWVDMTESEFLTSTGEGTGAQAGYSVSISGNILLVGAPFHDSISLADQGVASFYELGAVKQAKLFPDDRLLSVNPERFGYSISVSGDYLLVGAYQGDSYAGNELLESEGAAYVFHWNGSSFVEEGRLDVDGLTGDARFGWSVSISGDYAIIGAFYDDVGSNNNGSAYIFNRNSSGDWIQQAKFTGSWTDYFASSVGISGDYAVATAAFDDDSLGTSNTGCARVFQRSGSIWIETAKLIAFDRGENYKIGSSVSISGDYIIVGGQTRESAYIYELNGTVWGTDISEVTATGVPIYEETAKLVPGDNVWDDEFGDSVFISGDYALVGATGDDSNMGSVYLFTRDGSGNWLESGKLVASDRSADDYFGRSVSISGNSIIVGASYDDDNGTESGSVYVFQWDGLGWGSAGDGSAGNPYKESFKLTPSDGAANDFFGNSVGIFGDYFLSGSYGTDGDQGAVYMFQY